MGETISIPQTRDERILVIRQFIAERLFRKVDEVRLDSRLIGDLGADSLDFVDIQFQLESRFGLQFHAGEFFDFTYRWLTPEGCLRPEVVERIGTIIPEVRTAPDVTKIAIADLLNWITVETLVRIVEQKTRLHEGD
jgi:acyl carrier protein